MGIEPTCSAWKADILPLNYTRGFSDAYISYQTLRDLSTLFSYFRHKNFACYLIYFGIPPLRSLCMPFVWHINKTALCCCHLKKHNGKGVFPFPLSMFILYLWCLAS